MYETERAQRERARQPKQKKLTAGLPAVGDHFFWLVLVGAIERPKFSTRPRHGRRPPTTLYKRAVLFQPALLSATVRPNQISYIGPHSFTHLPLSGAQWAARPRGSTSLSGGARPLVSTLL